MQKTLWAGIDAGEKLAALCVTDALGKIIHETMIESLPSALDEQLKPFFGSLATVAIESHAVFLARELRKLGYPVTPFECRQASHVLAIRRNKTDLNDARGLADIARLGPHAVSEVYIKSVDAGRMRMQLALRSQLVRTRTAIEQALRAALAQYGLFPPRVTSARRLRQVVEDCVSGLRVGSGLDISQDIAPLLAMVESTRRYCETLDRQFAVQAKQIDVCRRFMEVPGVGPLCALSFYSAIETPDRFADGAHAASYFGLTPRIRESGAIRRRERISRMGNSMTRGHLTMAAWVLMGRSTEDTALRAWALKLKERIGFPRARVAVARKLASLLLMLWKSGLSFEAFPTVKSTA